MGFLSPTDNVSLWVWYQNHDPAISEKILKLSTTRIFILLGYWIFHSHLITIKVYYYTITTVIFTILTSGVISWLTSSSQPKHTHRNLFVLFKDEDGTRVNFSLLGSVEKDEVFPFASLLHRFLFLWEIYEFLACLKKYIWYCYYWCSERMERVLRRMELTCLK